MRKRWLIIPVVVLALAIASIGGAVWAQGSDEGDEPQGLASRVANILDLEEATVSEALEQAHDDMRGEALQAKLDAMVASGRITQDEADEYAAGFDEWVDSKPDGMHWMGGKGFGHHRGFHGRGFGRECEESEESGEADDTDIDSTST